jgi:hypothetical protein
MSDANYLAEFGYNALRIPQEKFDPLLIFMKGEKAPEEVGTLQELIGQGEAPLPAVEDQGTGDISGSFEARTKASVGVTILKLFAKLGGGDPAKVEAKFTDASECKFKINDPTLRNVSQVQLDKYIRAGVPDQSSNFIVPLSEDKIFVVWAALRSSSVEVDFEKSNGESLEIVLPELKELFGGGVNVSHSGESKSRIVVEGGEGMTFGFKALRMRENGLVSGGLEPMRVDGLMAEAGTRIDSDLEDGVIFEEELDLRVPVS